LQGLNFLTNVLDGCYSSLITEIGAMLLDDEVYFLGLAVSFLPAHVQFRLVCEFDIYITIRLFFNAP